MVSNAAGFDSPDDLGSFRDKSSRCAPQLRTHLESYDYWVECIPCDFKSPEFVSLKDAATAYAEHTAENEAPAWQDLGRQGSQA